MYGVYRQCVTDCGGGGVEMYCGPYSTGVLHSVSNQVRLSEKNTTPSNALVLGRRLQTSPAFPTVVSSTVDTVGIAANTASPTM
jgi:hypothetical protein